MHTKKHIRYTIAAMVAIAMFCAPAASSAQTPAGPRSRGMGGIITNLQAGVHSTDENPAALSRLSASSVGVTNADRHGLGIQDNSIGLTVPWGERWGLGIRWTRSSFEDDVIGDTADRIALAAGLQTIPSLSVGIGIHHRRYEQTFEGRDVGIGSGQGFDVAAEFDLSRHISFGAVWRDIGDTRLEFRDGERQEVAEEELRAGVTARIRPDLRVHTELGREWHAGAEVEVLSALTLRAGWSKDLDGIEGFRAAGGLSVHVGPASLDYAYRAHPTLDGTHMLGLRTDFTLSPRLVEVRELRLAPVFASLAPHHAENPVGSIVLQNLEDDPIEVRVTLVDLDEVRELFITDLLVRPSGSDRIEFPAMFGESVADMRQARPLRVRAEISYTSGGRRRVEDHTTQSVLYAPGDVQWALGVDQAAAFVTPDHPRIRELVRSSVGMARDARIPGLGEVVAIATTLFNTMSSIGLVYQPDPLNPYSHRIDDESAVDTVQYPSEFLDRGAGDCDDAVVLYASLLAHVGIRSAILDVPGHVFVMFDTAIPARERRNLGLPPKRFVAHQNSLWIPVETTMLGATFSLAWAEGARLLEVSDRSGTLRIWELGPAQRKYPALLAAADDAGTGVASVANPDIVERKLHADAAAVRTWSRDYLRDRFGDALAPVSAEEAAAIARVYFLRGEFDRARQQLEAYRDVGSAAVWNNLGTINAATGALREASVNYLEARRLDPEDLGIAANEQIVLALLAEQAPQLAPETPPDVSASTEELMMALSRRERPDILNMRGTAAGAAVQVALSAVRSLFDSRKAAAGGARATLQVDRHVLLEILYWKNADTDEGV